MVGHHAGYFCVYFNFLPSRFLGGKGTKRDSSVFICSILKDYVGQHKILALNTQNVHAQKSPFHMPMLNYPVVLEV